MRCKVMMMMRRGMELTEEEAPAHCSHILTHEAATMAASHCHTHLGFITTHPAAKKNKRKKKKTTPVYRYWHEYEPVGLPLLTIFRDAMYSVMSAGCIH
jgi:hypothetical protein